MKRFFVFAALAAFALTSCEQKIDIPAEIPTPGSSESTGLVFTATTESAVTKTALDDNYNVLWQNGDMITIVDGASHVGVYSTTSTTTQGEFTKVSGDMADTPSYTAYYPSTIYEGGTLTLPAEQTYVAENISGAPMMAVSSTTSLGFKNLVGIIKLSLTTNQSGQKVRSIALSANEGMSGSFTVTNDAAVVSGTAGVTLNCGTEGVAIGSTAIPFYIAVPAGTYSSLKITVTTIDGKVQTRTSKNGIKVGRSQITNITLGFNNLLASSLVQYWPFDGNAKNAVSGGVDATVSGATLTTDRFGNESSAYYFDGNDKMTAPDAANFGQTSFTANIWVCSNQTSGLGNLMRTDGGYYKGWLLRFNAGRVEIWEGRTSNYAYVSTNSYADGNWHMVTYVRDVENRFGKLYVDGNYIGGYSMTGNINDVTNELRFGTYGDGEYYTGKMDDARLYNKALSQEEISEIYDSSAFDLSATATANTYIVSAAGRYKFKATVKGNGGLDPLTGTTATTINPADIAGVKVLWELYNDNEKGISPIYHTIKYDSAYDISYSNGYVTFSTPDSFKEGAACVAIYDNSDNILWSWLIWATAEPGTVTHNGKTFMNKNLGATSRSDYSNNYIRGFLYQWGRKDAFSAAAGSIDDVYWYTPVAADVFTGVTTVESMAYTIAHPTTRIACWTSSTHSWMPEAEYSTSPWRDDVKTIYDPCPPGWKVPTKVDMDGISGLPDTGLYSSDKPGLRNFGNAGTGYYWTSTISSDTSLPANAWAFCNDGRNLNNWSQAEGYAIRPVRE